MTDFMELFEIDVILIIMALLDDPVDLLRVCAVSHSWRHFVIANGLFKKLWLNEVPKIDKIAYIGGENKTVDVHENAINWEALLWEHKIYSSILLALNIPIISPEGCISFAVGASSSDNQKVFWSSQGESDPNVPESILFGLNSKIGVVTEIDIRPMKAFREPGAPIYSAKSVRFRLGYLKSVDIWPVPCLENYEWTYTSPEFPMTQEYTFQQFRLPEPVVWVGGFLLIELFELDCAQSNIPIDVFFYIQIDNVRVLGRHFEPILDLVMTPLEELLMTCNASRFEDVIKSFLEERLQKVEEKAESKIMVMNLLDDDETCCLTFSHTNM